MANNVINILKLVFFLFFPCLLSTSHGVNMDNLKSGDSDRALSKLKLPQEIAALSLYLSLSTYTHTERFFFKSFALVASQLS